MNDMHDIFSKTLGDILVDFHTNTTIIPEHTPAQTPAPKKTKPKAKRTNSSKKPVNTPKIDSNPTDDIEFDLRKAVIYAELMTPKFKDEEF